MAETLRDSFAINPAPWARAGDHSLFASGSGMNVPMFFRLSRWLSQEFRHCDYSVTLGILPLRLLTSRLVSNENRKRCCLQFGFRHA